MGRGIRQMRKPGKAVYDEETAKKQPAPEGAAAEGRMADELEEVETLPLTFDERLFHSTVERVTVSNAGVARFIFRDGKTVEVSR